MSNIFDTMPAVTYQKSEPLKPLKSPEVMFSDKVDTRPIAAVNSAPDTDVYDSSSNTKPNKKGSIKSIKNFIANMKKSFASAGEYIKGFTKGVTKGAVAASLIYTGGSIFNHFSIKSAEKAGKEAKKIPNRFLAAGAAILAIGVNLWNASLNATERKSKIDHRWVGHSNK